MQNMCLLGGKLKEIYCQNCGNDITKQGADVSGSGRTYCHGYKEGGQGAPCTTVATFQGIEAGFAIAQYYTPRKVQNAIERKEITHFGPLEKKALEKK